jgi:hypothetical protein
MPLVELTAVERAKMDYEHGLKLKEGCLEKGCFTLLTGLFAALCLGLANYALEGYRAGEARERALTEQRLAALTAISAAHSQMTRVFFFYTSEDPDAPADKAAQEYEQAINNLRQEVNKHLVLLGKNFDEDMSWYIQIHRSFKAIGVTKCKEYGTLASNLDNEFNALCEAYLYEGKFPTAKRMTLKPISREEREAMNPGPTKAEKAKAYIAAHRKYRKEHKKNDD